MTSFLHTFLALCLRINTHELFISMVKQNAHEAKVSLQPEDLERLIVKSSQSHIATDGQSVSKSWCRAPSGAYDQIFITVWQLRSCFLWDALSDERTGLSFVRVIACISKLFVIM
jgi:hypothetical protein